jgi:hypothetical protein
VRRLQKKPLIKSIDAQAFRASTCPLRRLSLSYYVGRGTKSWKKKSRIKIPGDLKWDIQVAFVFTASRCHHEMLCMKTISASNTL